MPSAASAAIDSPAAAQPPAFKPWSAPSASETIAKRSPPMPFISGSPTPITALAAMAASTAWPPCSSTLAPACAASGWLAATMPKVVAIFERPATGNLMLLLCRWLALRQQRDRGVAIEREVFLVDVLHAGRRHGIDALGAGQDFRRGSPEHVSALQAAQPVAVLAERSFIAAAGGLLRTVDEGRRRSFLLQPAHLFEHLVCHRLYVLGGGAKAHLHVSAALLREVLRKAYRDRVGLPEVFAQHVAKPGLEHRRRRVDAFTLDGVHWRLGEEADHRLTARLASLFDARPLGAGGELNADVLEVRGPLAGGRERADVLRE